MAEDPDADHGFSRTDGGIFGGSRTSRPAAQQHHPHPTLPLGPLSCCSDALSRCAHCVFAGLRSSIPPHPPAPFFSFPLCFCPWAGRETICNGGNTRIGVFGPPIRPSSGESPRTLRQRVPALRASPSTTRASGEDGHRPELLRESGGDDRHSTVMQMAAGVLRAGHANSTGLMFTRTFEVHLVHCLQCGQRMRSFA